MLKMLRECLSLMSVRAMVRLKEEEEGVDVPITSAR